MLSYEARLCEGTSPERWCIFVNGACDHSLGEFNSKEEAETAVRRLILLREKVLAIDASAEFKVPEPTQNSSYIGRVVAVIEPSEGFGFGVAQYIGRGVYALHTKNSFADVIPQDISITVEYKNGSAKVLLPKTKERDGNER